MTVLVPVLYVVAFALFILGLSGLTGPRTAVRGNKIAALGMAVAVLATLLEVRHNWLLILLGLVVLGRLENPSALDAVILVVAIAFGMINVVGGFLVTDRMLGMFKARPRPPRPVEAEKDAP